MLARRDRADAVELSEIARAIRSRDANCFDRREAGFDQQFQFAMVAKARQYAAVAGRSGGSG